MHTIRVQGVVPPSIDAQIVDAISRAGTSPSRGPTAVIGIRNTEGRVYRLVHTAGVAESLALAAGLELLGLVDDPAEFDKARQGCDSIFSVPDWHPSQQGDAD